MKIFIDNSHSDGQYSTEKVKPANELFVFPTSFPQQGLWLLDRLTDTTVSYIIPNGFRLQGRLDVTALETALNAIILRHETLRTYFSEQGGAPVQIIQSSFSIPLTRLDLSGYSAEHRASESARLIQANSATAFDLEKLPLLRVQLLRLGEEDHIFLLACHHIISDAWSMEVLMRELSALYGAFSLGLPSPLPELPIQYADYTVWQREWLQGETLEPLLNYWKTWLAGAPILELPTDKPRPALQSFRGATQQFSLPPGLAEALKVLSQREEVTLFMTLMAAFQLLLHRYSGQDDIVIGTPVAGRSSLELENLVGYFVNILVLRADLSDNPSFRELLAQVREVVLGAYAHQDMPFEKLVEAINPQRDLSRNPLFQVMFAFQSTANVELQLNEMTAETLQLDSGTAKFDLTLELSETPHGLVGRMEYATDLFEAATISRLIGHFQTLLEGIVARPEARLSDLPLLTEAERRQLLTDWNDTAVSFPEHRCIHELFEAQAAATPQAPALVYEQSRLGYAELNAQANRLAHYLCELGVKPDARVAICVERGLTLVIGLLAILKAGGAYVPLDPAYPKDRLEFMLEDSAPVALLTQGRLESLFAGRAKALPMIDLEAEHPPWANRPDTNLERHELKLTPQHLAYVIYTSGSTGKPKGVMVEHINVVNFLCAMAKAPGLSAADSLLAVTTVSFDIAGLELFLPLIKGAKIVLISRANAADAAFLQQTIAQSGITVMQATPATWRLLLNGGWQGSSGLKALCGGEALATDLSTPLRQAVGELWNLYGPTETTVWSTAQVIDNGRSELYPYETIGRPIDNSQIYILDEHLQPVPPGVSGEIYIGGAGVARGYLNRPELTAERFASDPFAAKADARMYKTGDLARWLADGSIEYLGRNDFQVKIRGFRIEIGEIEAVLRQHPQLGEVAVGVYEPAPGDKRLAAYVAPRQNAPVPTAAELRDFLKPKLPEFMLPSAFVFLDALPLTPNGKLDRKALPEPDRNRPVADTEFIAPRNPIEQQLAEIWAEVLKLNRIGIHDNFFELSGHSLLAVKVVAEINKQFNTDLALGVIYQSPTIEQLGTIIASGNRQPSWYSLVPIQTQGSRPPLFAIHTITLLDLPRHLGKDQPLYFLRYGMAAVSKDHSITLPLLKDVASHYIKEMQQLQPDGPYHLMGFSFGGMIAYEMAKQLLANGYPVNLVGLLDTYLAEEQQLLSLHRIIHNFFRQNPSQFIEGLKNRIMNLITPYKYGADFWPHIYTPAPDIACRNGYQLNTYEGRVTLFQASDQESMFFTQTPPEQEWKKLLGDRLEVQQISGKHFDICKEPHVKTLAAKIIACMDKAINDGCA